MAQSNKNDSLPIPLGHYQSVVIRNGFGVISGQFPFENGQMRYQGLLGQDVSFKQGQAAVLLAAKNTLAQLKHATDGFVTLDGLLRVDAYLACDDGFTQHALVLDSASGLFTKVLAEKGNHARSVTASHRLPGNACVELVVSFATKN